MNGEAAEELLGEEPSSEEASPGAEGSNTEGEEQERKDTGDAQLRADLQKTIEHNQKIMSELSEHKKVLAQEREERKRILLGLAGTDAGAVKDEQLRNKVKQDFLHVFPHLKDLVEGTPKEPEPSPAEMNFYNSARDLGMTKAKSMGADDIGAQTLVGLGDFLIQNVPELKERFFRRGDMKVVEEVNTFIQNRVLGPILKAHEQKVIARIRRTGLAANPLGGRTGGTGASGKSSGEDKGKYDFSPAGKAAWAAKIYHSATEGEET